METNNLIFKTNTKLLFKSTPVISALVIAAIVNLFLPIWGSLIFNDNIRDSLNQIKYFVWSLFLLNILIVGFQQVYAIHYLIERQKTGGVHNLELRFGVKSREIFFIRLGVILLAGVVIFSIEFLCSVASLYVLGGIPEFIFWDKILSMFLFVIFFMIFISTLTLLLYGALKGIVSMILGILFSALIGSAPALTNIQYSKIGDNNLVLVNEIQNITKSNARLKISEDMFDFLQSHEQYKSLVESYSDFTNLDQDTLAWWRNTFLIGNIASDEGKIESLENNELIKLSHQIARTHTNSKLNQYDSIFSVNSTISHENIFNYKNTNMKKYINEVIGLNLDGGKYNDLFKYVRDISGELIVYNFLQRSADPTGVRSNGAILEYEPISRFANFGLDDLSMYENNFYRPEFIWMISTLFKMSETLDSNVITTLKHYDEYRQDIKNELMFNPFNHIDLMTRSISSNDTYDDLWNSMGDFFIGLPNNYYSFTLSSEINRFQSTASYNKFRFKKLTQESEVKSLKLKSQKYVQVWILYIFYTAIAALALYIGYILFTRKLIV